MQSGIGDVVGAYVARRAASRATALALGLRQALALALALAALLPSGRVLAGPPRASGPLAARASLRLPLFDGADPLPWPVGAANAAQGGTRADLLAGAALRLDRPAELSLDLRWSPYGVLLADQQVVFAQRLTTELGGMIFVGEHVAQGEGGLWTGGFVDLRLGGELRGRRVAGDPPLVPATAHAALGFRKELGPGAAASLSIGGGAVLDPRQLSGGLLVLVTVLGERPL